MTRCSYEAHRRSISCCSVVSCVWFAFKPKYSLKHNHLKSVKVSVVRRKKKLEGARMPPQVVDRLELDPGSGLLSESEANHFPRVKCVLIGDGAIGKTSLVVSYTTNGYPTEYVPTAFDNYTVVVTVDNRPIRLQLCDTAGQDDFDTLRPLCYPNTDIFLVCFSVVSPTSFHNLTEKWLPELREHSPKVPIILVGTQCDLRNDVKVLIDLANYNERPIPENEAQAKAREIGAVSYVECSALTQKNLKEVFDAAILATITGREIFKKQSKKKSKKSKQKDEYKSTQKAPSDSKPRKGWKKLCCVV